MTAADAAEAAEVEAAQWLGWQKRVPTVQCRVTVVWYDLDPTPRRCVRPDGHAGPHADGVRWFDRHGLQVPGLDDQPEPDLTVDPGWHAGWKERAGIPRAVDPHHRAQTDRRMNRSRT